MRVPDWATGLLLVLAIFNPYVQEALARTLSATARALWTWGGVMVAALGGTWAVVTGPAGSERRGMGAGVLAAVVVVALAKALVVAWRRHPRFARWSARAAAEAVIYGVLVALALGLLWLSEFLAGRPGGA